MHVVGDNACKTAWGHIIHNTIPAFRERIEALFVVKYSNFCKCSMEACKDRLYTFIKNIMYMCAFLHVIIISFLSSVWLCSYIS